MSDFNEKELINSCLKGDRKAHKKLYDHYAKMMFGICLRYSNGYEEAKDILQEGFIKVFTKMNQYRFSGSFEGWMKRIFVNTALEYYRLNKHYLNESDVESAAHKPHHDFTLERISQKEILAALNKLAPGYRTVFNMYAIEGYTHAEIGEMLGISEGTSKSQLSRARMLLQEALKQLHQESK